MAAPKSARALFSGECRFMAGAATLSAIPEWSWQEVAFIGRSNVGKSSLINALTNRKTLARISATPGCTRQFNFFLLAESLMLVDLPGYGHAKVSKKELAAWTEMIKDYLRGRPNLRRVCLLVDARRGLSESDTDMLKLLDDCAVTTQLVLTKRDKLTKDAAEAVIRETEAALKTHPAAYPLLAVTSAESREGVEALQEELAALVQEKRR